VPVKLALPSVASIWLPFTLVPSEPKQSAEIILDCLATSSLQTSDKLEIDLPVWGLLLEDVRDKFPETTVAGSSAR